DLDVLVAGDADAALEAALDLGGVVLEAAQRPDLPLVDHAVVAEESDAGVPRDDPLDDHAAADEADLRDAEGLAHLGAALGDLLLDAVEEAGHRLLDLVGQVVDDRVEADVD